MKPSYYDVDAALKEIQDEEEREQAALRAFYERERPVRHITGWQVVKFTAAVIALSGIAYVLVVLWFAL